MTEWVVLELTPQGEDEDPDVLRSSLLRTLRGSEIFIPASISKVGDSRVVHKLIDNYVFVKREQPDHFYFKIEGTKYVTSVLTVPSGRNRRISAVRDTDIAKMKRQIQVETEQGIEVDDEVEVMSGAYKGIRGRVIEEIPENDSVQVYISLRSKQTIITLPRSFLRFVPAEDQSDVPAFAPFLTKLVRIQELVRRAQAPLEAMSLDMGKLYRLFGTVKNTMPWVSRMSPLVHEVMGGRELEDQLEDQLPEASILTSKLKRLSLMGLYVGAKQMILGEPALSKAEPPDTAALRVKLKEVQDLSGRATPMSSLLRRVTAGNELVSDSNPSTQKILDLLDKVDFLHRVEFQGRAIKYQLSKIEASIRKAEENARSKRRR